MPFVTACFLFFIFIKRETQRLVLITATDNSTAGKELEYNKGQLLPSDN